MAIYYCFYDFKTEDVHVAQWKEVFPDVTDNPRRYHKYLKDDDKKILYPNAFSETKAEEGETLDLQAVVDKVQPGGTIKFDTDVNVAAPIKIEKNMVINLNGHTITDAAPTKPETTTDTPANGETIAAASTADHLITVGYGATVTITGNGTLRCTAKEKACICNNGNLVINGGTFLKDKGDGSYYVLLNHGMITVNGGVFMSRNEKSSLVDNGYYNYGSGKPDSGYVEGVNMPHPTLEINNGTFDGGLNSIKIDDGGVCIIHNGEFINQTQGVVMNWNKCTIYGGNFDGSKATVGVISNGWCDPANDIGDLKIFGGMFVGDCGLNDGSDKPKAIAGFQIYGGTFTNDVFKQFIAPGYEASQGATYTVSKIQ